ncbi:NgoFVII family restriction endonuclease [Pasteurellaceae bacterium TAE3-ERU1]|nr:NgoFVII family restriction endonuclease [Pasteurellaceae bacterium TAE3-ERU1]
MNTVFSNIANANITNKSLNLLWMDLFKSANEVLITTGYVSSDAVVELHKILELNSHIRKIELLVGMHYLEGFSKLQYEGLCKLNHFLQQNQRGGVFISPFVKFHGKMYSFQNDQRIDGLIGSANLTCFWDRTERTYETMLHLEGNNAKNLQKDIQSTIQKLGKPINEAEKPDSFIAHNNHLENCLGVSKVDPFELVKIFSQSSQYRFLIPAKTEEKSNLNVFFGEGRRDKRGFIKPRPWYEVELIVSNKITTQKGYPYCQTFTVITDDGWQFQCKTSGDYSKNFRSESDLKTLGKWIKGRLEGSGYLQVYEKISEETLRKYGNDKFELRSTNKPDIWLLSFKSEKPC